MKIVPLGDDVSAWDQFVNARGDATFFHLACWRDVIQQAFGHKAHYLMAVQDGAIAGVLPLVQVKTRLFGHSLISNPFCVYGGPLTVDPAATRALSDHAASLMRSTGAAATEFRFLNAPPEDDLGPLWQTPQALYVTFRKSITGDDEANLKSIPRKQRAVVRKGIERGLTAQTNRDVETLHRIYAESVRNLGTPVFSRRYFRLLAHILGPKMDVVTVSSSGQPVAAVMNFYWRDEVLPYYGGGTPAARACYANDFMYWETMRRAAVAGCRTFDFGRSKLGTGSFAFKKNWGFTPTPLHYRTLLAEGRTMPEVNPLNPKYRLLIAAWKRLPLPIANAIGPFLVRGVG
jgi:FemAB-related protein (PEP-CTERM system-associated)